MKSHNAENIGLTDVLNLAKGRAPEAEVDSQFGTAKCPC